VKTLRLLNRIAPVFAAGAILLIADGALAKGNNNGDHDHGQNHSDYSQMKSQSSKSDHSDKQSEKHKDKSGEMRSESHKDKDSKHAEKTKDKHKDKTGTTTTTSASNPPAPGTGGTNNIHPIMSPARNVTVSNGVTTTILHGESNVIVQSLEPGKITVRGDNGQSVTLPGGSVNVTGAAIVGSGVAIERVNRPNGDVTLAIGPEIRYPGPATPPGGSPGHVISSPGTLSGISDAIGDAGAAIGHGLEELGHGQFPGGATAGRPEQTSTTTQQ
jgi:hypothetical protein